MGDIDRLANLDKLDTQLETRLGTKTGTPAASGRTATEPLYVCVHVPEFPAQARLRSRPEYGSQPVVVLDGDPPLEHVCSANNKALALGVSHGATRTELDSFTGVLALRRSLEEERTARAGLLHLAGSFTPRTQVCPFTQTGSFPFAMVLDMTGSSRIFGCAAQVVHSITKAVRSLGMLPRLAASGNYRAAVCASAYAFPSPIVIRPDREHEALRTLPLAALGITEAQQSMFDLWGLRTVGELAALPEVELIVRLGQEGKRLRQLARGEHPHLMAPEEAVFALEEFLAFDSPEDRLDALLFVLGPMLDQIIQRAQAYALALASVTVKLTLEGGTEHTRTLKPALPLTEREVLLKLLHLDLQAHPPDACVVAVHLRAEPGPRSKVQAGLFAPPLPEPMQLDVTLARLAALVGEERVGSARLRDTHSPEGFVVERFVVREGASSTQTVNATTALRRLRPPVLLNMRLQGREPSAFFFQGKHFEVADAYGPWRRSGEWWSESVWSREEWDVRAETRDGQTLLCVMVQDLLKKSWQLDALYD